MTAFVLDNSVTMRWCFENAAHPYADDVLGQLAEGAAHVPVLWRYEVSAVLAKSQRDSILTDQKVNDFLDTLNKLNIIVDTEGPDRIFTDVHRLAVTYRLTSYDAAYLELAVRRNLPLATLDKELIAASQACGVTLL